MRFIVERKWNKNVPSFSCINRDRMSIHWSAYCIFVFVFFSHSYICHLHNQAKFSAHWHSTPTSLHCNVRLSYVMHAFIFNHWNQYMCFQFIFIWIFVHFYDDDQLWSAFSPLGLPQSCIWTWRVRWSFMSCLVSN